MVAPRFQLNNTDAVSWLRSLPSASVDLVVTDPPYESLEKHRAVGTTTRLKHSKASSNDWFKIFPNKRFAELFVEVFRVLKRNRHFYLFCDQETMFVAKPIAEQVGFKFWKPLVWDKCLGPDTPVWSTRGVIPIEDLEVGDEVAIPEGGKARVRGVRRTRARARRLRLSDGTELTASLEHRLIRADGAEVEARGLTVGDVLATRPVKLPRVHRLPLADLIPEQEAVFELPESESCLWCGRRFDSSRAAAAHQARFCDQARSKQSMARWFPESVALDYDLGKFIGLFAAEGNVTAAGVSFALHREEKHLQHLVERQARALGVRAQLYPDGNKCVVLISFKVARYLVEHFVGGGRTPSKFFREVVYAAPEEFRRGVLAGLLEGDGHWSSAEQRETLNSSSLDLASFAQRMLSGAGAGSTIRPFENECSGGWKVRHDPRPVCRPDGVVVEHIEDAGVCELVDISIDHPDELFVLGNGVVSHNCKIGMGYHYRARYELVLFFEKGKRKLNDLGIPDILEVPRVYRGYPAEKPPQVSEILIGQSTQPGELVIDPFMGSGSAGVAAANLERNFAGNDICVEAVDITRKRLLDAGAISGKVIGSGADPDDPQLGLTLR